MAVDRFHAQQGQVVRLRATFTFAGTVIDPFDIRQVEIRNASDQVVATFGGAAIVRESLGVFYVDWPIPSNEPLEVHFDRWYATGISGGSEEPFTFNFLVLSFSSSVPGASYMTLSQAREFLPSDTGITDAHLMNQVALCQRIVELKSGQHFLPITEARRFNGTGRRVLPVKLPILRVSEARVLSCQPDCGDGSGDILIDPCTIRISQSATMLGLGNVQRFDGRYDHGYPYQTLGCCDTWPSGFMNIQITGDWGIYEEVPVDIQAVMGVLLRHAGQCDDAHGLPIASFESESIPGDRNYTLRKIWTNVKLNNMTGFPEVDAILSSYLPKMFVGVV